MASSTDERRAQVLRAIVSDYISTSEPVGSKALVERHNLGVSPATIRNDMGVLEDQGFITQQHASSGRVPTEKGYRAFVDTLDHVRPLSRSERRAMMDFLSGGVDMEDVLRRSVQLLAQLTQQVAVVQVPTLRVSRIKHCEVVQLAPHRLLLVVIVDTGRVDQRNVELAHAIEPELVPYLRNMMNDALAGQTFSEAADALAGLAVAAPADLAPAVVSCATVLLETFVEAPNDRLILAGAANLARPDHASDSAAMQSVLDALEEQVVVLRLLTHAQDFRRVQVSIGEEIDTDQLRGTSVVSTGYGTPEAMLGGLGVVGPTRMDYPHTMAHVAAVAQYMGDILRGS